MSEEAAFVQLIKENRGILLKVSNVYSNNYEDQKDLYQEIVFQLWKSFDSFRGDSKISTWMYRIALNTSISNLRKQKRKGEHVPLQFELYNLADEEDRILQERMALVNEHIQRLSVVEKGLILLHLEGKNYDEISVITGFTSTNVGTRLTRIKQKLKTQINN